MKGPVFTKEPDNRIDFSNSTGAVVECRANGSPPPEIIWVRSDGTAVGDVPGLRQVTFLNMTFFLMNQLHDFILYNFRFYQMATWCFLHSELRITVKKFMLKFTHVWLKIKSVPSFLEMFMFELVSCTCPTLYRAVDNNKIIQISKMMFCKKL
jgi:hypothetical protein